MCQALCCEHFYTFNLNYNPQNDYEVDVNRYYSHFTDEEGILFVKRLRSHSVND